MLIAAEVQYTGHSSLISGLCWLGVGVASSCAHLASCEASGSLHIWSATTGASKLILREPGTTSERHSASAQSAVQAGPTGSPATLAAVTKKLGSVPAACLCQQDELQSR